MDIHDFSVLNRRRCEAPKGFNHPISGWTLSDWMTATAGELGEAANVIKKLNRVRDGIPGNDKTEEELRAQLADEIADTYTYLDLLAQAAGISLQEAVISKFRRVSEKIGYGHQGFDMACGPAPDHEVAAMASRFLQWKLPADFAPDGGISFKAEFNEGTAHPMRYEPVGTNLFNAAQAEAMVRHILGLSPTP